MHICYLREPIGVFHIKNVRTFSLHKELLPNLTNSTLDLINIQTFVNSEFTYFFLFTNVNICQSYVPINNAVFPAQDVGDDDDTLYISAIIL